MRCLVIINPIAGRRGRRYLVPAERAALARRLLAQHHAAGDAEVTTCAGHAEDLARRAARDGYDVVFAWGGDGTVNEVARGIAFTSTALAFIPAGSGNGLARALGVPREPAEAIAHAMRSPERQIDAGMLGGRFFANVAGVGLDAEVAAQFNRRPIGRRGALPYVWIAMRTTTRYPALDYRLTLDDETFCERALIVAVANSPEYGNGAIVAPGAVPDDGRLDVVVVRDRSVAGRLMGAKRLLEGTLDRAGGILRRSVQRVVIEADAPTLRFHTDGDTVEGPGVLAGAVQARALRIRA